MARHAAFTMLLTCALLCSGLASATTTNLVVGTQEIYGPTWDAYNFTSAPNVLAEQRQVIVGMGGNQLKIKLSGSTPGDTCMSYRIGDPACRRATSLKELAMQPAIAATLAMPGISFYHIWMYTFASGSNWLQRDWTEAGLAAEKKEVKELALHLLQTYNGTGKVFMCGE